MTTGKMIKLPETAHHSPKNPLDTLKWVIIVVLFTTGVYANSHFATMVAFSLRLGAWVLLTILLCALALWTQKGQQFWAFIKLVQDELRRVVWPTRQETLQTTAVVIAMVVVVALFLWGVDSILILGMGFLTGLRG